MNINNWYYFLKDRIIETRAATTSRTVITNGTIGTKETAELVELVATTAASRGEQVARGVVPGGVVSVVRTEQVVDNSVEIRGVAVAVVIRIVASPRHSSNSRTLIRAHAVTFNPTSEKSQVYKLCVCKEYEKLFKKQRRKIWCNALNINRCKVTFNNCDISENWILLCEKKLNRLLNHALHGSSELVLTRMIAQTLHLRALDVSWLGHWRELISVWIWNKATHSIEKAMKNDNVNVSDWLEKQKCQYTTQVLLCCDRRQFSQGNNSWSTKIRKIILL